MTVIATTPELAIMRELDRLEINYEFQSKMLGGYGEKGSTRADFLIPSLNLAISCVGEYWHLNRPDVEMKDMLQRVALENSGIRVIRILASDALRNARYYVEEALMGIDHSGLG
uniref:Uncharacterized protein n=1 Tax=viral metagenome TaxID=1070528 RepID=A0A6M3IWX5_9ZZZZ